MTRTALSWRIDQLVREFGAYVHIYDQNELNGAWRPHDAAISRYRALGIPPAAATLSTDTPYLGALSRVLRSWRAFGRPPGFRYPTTAAIGAVIAAETVTIDALSTFSLADPQLDVPIVQGQVWSLIQSCTQSLNPGGPPLVGGSKFVHHLLPELVPPFDREGTGWFFGWPDSSWTTTSAQQSFFEAFPLLHDIAVRTNAAQFVTKSGWRTSVSKVIDNAICASR